MNDEEFFTLINRAYKRAEKAWDYQDPAIMRGALGYCDLDWKTAWVDHSLEPRVRNHVLLHELAHLVAEETDDYHLDEIIVEQATRVVLSLKDYLSPMENVEFMERIWRYGLYTEQDIYSEEHYDRVSKLIDELLKLFEEEDQ